MALIEFKNLPDTDTPLNAENLNNNFNELQTQINSIVEIGSNDNGIYIKYEDGTMICRTTLNTNNQNAEYHYSSGIWEYPVSFNGTPTVIGTADNWSTAMVTVKVKAYYNTCNVMTHSFSLATKDAIDETHTINLIAVGKWK